MRKKRFCMIFYMFKKLVNLEKKIFRTWIQNQDPFFAGLSQDPGQN